MDGSSVLGKGQDMASGLLTIQPYWHEGTWVFDDEFVGLEKEPLEGGLSGMVNYLVKDIPNARQGFILLLSSQPFAGYQVELTRGRQELGGFTYEILAIPTKDYRRQVWLPRTLVGYFVTAPESLYVKAEPRRAKYDRIREVVALRSRVEKLEQLVGKLTLENDILRRAKDY